MRMVFLALTLTLLSQRASADPATASAEEKQAEQLAADGDFVGAATHYKLAYAADPRPDLICNAGVAYYKAKDATRAHLYLSRCQERGTALDASFVSNVRSALAAVETMLRGGAFTPVDILTKPEGAMITVQSLGPTDSFVGPRLVWLPSGKHTLSVRADGYVDRTVELEAKGVERQPVEVVLERPVVVHQPSTVPNGEVPPQQDTPPRRPSKVPALIAIGGSVLAFAIAGVAYAQAHDAADMAHDAVSTASFDSDKTSTENWNTVMGVGGVLGIVGAGVSAFLVLRW